MRYLHFVEVAILLLKTCTTKAFVLPKLKTIKSVSCDSLLSSKPCVLYSQNSNEELPFNERTKLVSESIAPWRTLRLFLYFSLGSGAFIGGLITLSGAIAAMKGLRSDVDLNTEYLNLAIDFGAATAFGVFAKLDSDKGQELNEKVEKQLVQQQENAERTAKMRKREKEELLKLSLDIQVSEDGKTMESSIDAIQKGAKQHVIIVAGSRKVTKDALLGANLLKLDFSMSNILVVPFVVNDKKEKERPSVEKGFGDRPVWEKQPYIARAVGDGWEEYIEQEVSDAVEQSGPSVIEEGVVIALANNGKVIRRGVGKVPWRQITEELQESVAPKEKED